MPTSQDFQTTRETADVFTWTFPGAPISIQMDSEVIALLSRLTSRPGGGLLLGRRSSPGTLEVTGCEPVAAENGHLHSAIVQAKQRSLPQEHGSGSATSILGYYRTHTSDPMAIAASDLEAVEKAFHENQDVILLIQPNAGGPATGGFFFSTGIHMPSEVSFLEFPLDPAALPTRRIVRNRTTAMVHQQETIPAIASAPSRVGQKPEASSRTTNWSGGSLIVPMGLATALGVIGLAIMFLSHARVPPTAPIIVGTLTQNQINPHVTVRGAILSHLPIQVSAETMETSRPSPRLLVNDPQTNRTELWAQTQLTSQARDIDKNKRTALERPAAFGFVVQSHEPARSTPLIGTPVTTRVQTSRPRDAPNTTATNVRQAGEASEGVGAQQSSDVNSISQHIAPTQSDRTPAVSTPPDPMTASRVASAVEAPVQGPPAEVRAPLPALPPAGSSVNPLRAPAITDPQPIRRPQPTVPLNMLHLLSKEVVVFVRLQIDQSGNVVQATSEALHGESFGGYLAARALAAAKSWKFEPAKIGTHDVPSEKVVEFRFRPPPR